MASSVMRIGCWNVNSLKVRLDHLAQFLQAHPIEVLALQETKTVDEQFPVEAITQLGYQVLFYGQKTYNGVAILSRTPARELKRGIPGFTDPQARVLTALIDNVVVVNVYVPNGQTVGSDKYQYKLAFLQALHGYVQTLLSQYPQVVVLGDFNIAPDDRDVHDPKAWEGEVLVSAAERQALTQLMALGLTDVFRRFEQKPHSFSWWDYRGARFDRNAGLRIDLILASQALGSDCQGCEVIVTPRTWERPSDHTPVVASFAR
jgi:exodeoxyribonuclease III